ncbi:PGF-pre-PGF domain-containing protein [Candidatus Woesearchaeota archaeon]|nr:PGF-pre-PGF domain-containing protein [Candidatus Woesearchaeota archaeon]
MNLAKERISEIEKINRNISKAKELKKKVKFISSKLKTDYEKGVISYWEYQSLLKQRFGNKSESHWLNYYDSYIEDLENKLPRQTTNNRLVVLSILLIMGLGILFFNNYTGFTTKISDEEAIIHNIVFSTLDKQIYVPELVLEESETSENPINVATFTTYKYVKIKNPPSLDKIKEIEIEFKVKKSWLISNNIPKDKIVLYESSNNKWSPTFTKLNQEDTTYYHYSSKTTAINEFAIGSESEETVKVVRLKPKAIQKIGLYSFITENKEIILYGIIPISIILSLLILILNFIIRKLSHKSKKEKEVIDETYR